MKRIPWRIFTEEFKRETIKLVNEQGLAIAEASRKLDTGWPRPPRRLAPGLGPWRASLARSKPNACITIDLQPVIMQSRLCLSTSRCPTTAFGVMPLFKTTYPPTTRNSSIQMNYKLQHN